MTLLPTPPKWKDAAEMEYEEIDGSIEEWHAYGLRVHDWALSQVEQTETRGICITVEYDHPGGSVAHRAYFCRSCSSLHADLRQYDSDDNMVMEIRGLDPADIRASVRRQS